MKSKAAKLLEIWNDAADSEVGENSPLHELIQSILKKASIPDNAYHLADYGVDAMSPAMESPIQQALMKAGLKAVVSGAGRIVVTK